MEEDLIAGLTRQVKEEVVENYLAERRLIGLQIEEIETRAANLKFQAAKTGKRLSRLAFLMIQPEMTERLVRVLGIPTSSFWHACLEKPFSKGVRLIRVRALTDRGKYKKLVLEAYDRLYVWMGKYAKEYNELREDCGAINTNIRSFQKNFDLLAILSFLRGLDIQGTEKSNFLGENFTPGEKSSVDQKLYVRTIAFESMEIPTPLELSTPAALEQQLTDLAQDVYRRSERRIKDWIK